MKDCPLKLTASKPALRISQEPYLDWLTLTGELQAYVNLTISIVLKHTNGSFDMVLLPLEKGQGSVMYGYQEGMAAGRWECIELEPDGVVPDDITITLAEPFAIEVIA